MLSIGCEFISVSCKTKFCTLLQYSFKNVKVAHKCLIVIHAFKSFLFLSVTFILGSTFINTKQLHSCMFCKYNMVLLVY
jgi:hypothetical protein